MKKKKIIIGLIAGVSVGIIAALLLSTDKGSEVRKKIMAKTNNLGDSLKDWLGSVTKNAKDLAVASN
jgi:gas vesicle protein